ncbi:MAG: hypothetical protein U1E65_29590 [Myxococcota bacterium]
MIKRNLLFTLTVLTTACGGSSAEDQRPPTTGRVDVEAWLSQGLYKNWHCEASAHAQRNPSPHTMNRICSNDLASAHGAGTYPVDAAAVKELYDAAGSTIVGYAVMRKVTTATTGDAWYFYERVPMDSPAPHDSNGVVADGMGNSGTAKSICVGCHAGAGVDAMHSGHDFFYTQVK